MGKNNKNSIESVLKQSYSDWELIIVDNASKDSTAKIIHSYELIDSRIKTILCSQFGVVYARKIGIENAKGEYIAFLDADDCFKPHALAQLKSLIDADDYDIISFGYDIVDSKGSMEICKPIISGACTDVEFFHLCLK